jgi:hypothetical protein
MYSVVFANITVMCLNRADMSESWRQVKFWTDVGFTAAFAVEAALQICGASPHGPQGISTSHVTHVLHVTPGPPSRRHTCLAGRLPTAFHVPVTPVQAWASCSTFLTAGS